MAVAAADTAMPHPTTAAATILRIPSEIVELSLVHAHPRDVAAFAQSCRTFYALVYSTSDVHLWRLLWFAQGFEDPRLAEVGVAVLGNIDWKKELQARIHAELLLTTNRFHTRPQKERTACLQTLVDALMSVPAHNEVYNSDHTFDWVRSLLVKAGLHDRPVVDLIIQDYELQSSTVYSDLRLDDEIVLRHRLHTYLGLSSSEMHHDIQAQRRTEARCFVYDLRNYTHRNNYGPMISGNDNSVNWVHADHLMEIISRNLNDHQPAWETNRPHMGLHTIRPYSAPGTRSRKQRDWAGVEGKWRRIVCFMDYRDLYEYNFAHGGLNGSRDCSVFSQPEFEEATRFIYLELHITGYSPAHSTEGPIRSVDTKNLSELGPRPTIHFAGSSRGGNGNEASVKGMVRTTPSGDIRWSFVSIFDGQLQWSSEGVQIGSVASAVGIIGTWTGALHDERDPAGPFWLWKTGHLDHCHKCGKRL